MEELNEKNGSIAEIEVTLSGYLNVIKNLIEKNKKIRKHIQQKEEKKHYLKFNMKYKWKLGKGGEECEYEVGAGRKGGEN